MKFSTVLLTSALLLTPTMASAGIIDGWSGETSLTGSRTTGNTDTIDAGLGLKVQKEDGPWRHKFKGLVDYGETNGDQNRQRFALGYQIDRDINDRFYVYGNADYFNDDFGAFESGYFLGGGAGYKLILPSPLSWNLEGGPGFRSQRTQAVAPLESITDNELAVRGFSDIDYVLNDNVSLYNDTEIIYSSSDTYIWNETGITATLLGNLAARASYRVDTHSNPPIGSVGTDTVARFGVVYTMK